MVVVYVVFDAFAIEVIVEVRDVVSDVLAEDDKVDVNEDDAVLDTLDVPLVDTDDVCVEVLDVISQPQNSPRMFISIRRFNADCNCASSPLSLLVYAILTSLPYR